VFVGLNETSRKIRETTKNLKQEVRDIVGDFGDVVPRPLIERKTILLKQPLLKTLVEMRKQRG